MNKKIIILFSLFIVFLTLPSFLLAATDTYNYYADAITQGTPVAQKGDLVGLIFRVIQYIIGLLGAVAIIIIIYAGFMWMTAGGSDEKVGKAKKTLMAGLIGLGIIILAYAIASFVISKVGEFATPTP